MQLLKNYLSRYVQDAIAFVLAFSVAASSILPMVTLTYREFFPFVYFFVGLIGLPLIIVLSTATAVFKSYRYKFLVIGIAASLMLHELWHFLGFEPSTISPEAVSWNGIIFAQLLFGFTMIYGFRERHRIKARWELRAKME